MNNHNKEIIKTSKRKKASITCYGMHPGGGFVAWPDGKTTAFSKKEEGRLLTACCGKRKGFVAWPDGKTTAFSKKEEGRLLTACCGKRKGFVAWPGRVSQRINIATSGIIGREKQED